MSKVLKDLHLVCSGLVGNIYVSKISKKDPKVMTNFRKEIPQSEFIDCIINWMKSKTDLDLKKRRISNEYYSKRKEKI